ncbi:hypothetical protein [Micromonospora mirobrigensis]|uniref:Uncharacterized protein n=1 Tax=Micromonospora mirobrigensis TaxID=262898 RepID=A0A1C4W8R7_9ACTN|nr:hypothetical protein [Micromonospora mirobrigensis]SCE92595.1 hypothetical protein GA0070564_10290 [Micromonospora mirobrigensis]
MEPSGRALPKSDHAALLGVLSILSGHLMAGALPVGLVDGLVRRLTEHGPLRPGASAGELALLLEDLAQRMHWAMGDGDDPYPEASPRRNTYRIEVPAEAVPPCVDALVALGGADIHILPGSTGNWTTLPAGPDGELERHSTDVPDGRTVLVDFPDLIPDPAYHERVRQLTVLAEHLAGRFAGTGG